MAKTVFKEIAIGLLLLIAVILLLGILLYDYIPNSVTVPKKEQAHELPQEIKEELKETLAQESQNIIKTYYIDSSALTVYENIDSYDKGKRDPFTSYKTSTAYGGTSTGTTGSSTSGNSSSNGTTNNNGSTNNNNTSGGNSNTTGNNASTGTYFNTPGKN